jgi:hypothetical protein
MISSGSGKGKFGVLKRCNRFSTPNLPHCPVDKVLLAVKIARLHLIVALS